MASGVSVPVTASPYSLGISPREPVPNRLVFGHTGTEPQAEVKLKQCILLVPKLLGFVGGDVEVHQVPSKPESKIFFTSPETKGTMKIQACRALQMVLLLPQI